MVTITPHHYARGGLLAHCLRRLVHLSGLLLLWIYYQYGAALAHAIGITLPQLIGICLAVILLLEVLRLLQGWVIFGQRDYERNHLSAFAWGAIGMALVLLFAPGKQFAIPIICAYAIGDPLLGELRRTRLSRMIVVAIGILVISAIWWLAHIWLGTPLWLAFLMGPLTVAAEWPCLRWIDDNALIQLAPLVVVLIIHGQFC